MNLLRLTPASALKTLLRRTLDVADEETTCRGRGFRVTDERRRAFLDAIGGSFVRGYRAGLGSDSIAQLAAILEGVDQRMRGFAYEGAGMALALRDFLQPFRGRRVRDFLGGAGAPYRHVVHVGVGWARARLGRPPSSLPSDVDPLLRWLVVDGHGFHQGFFAWREFVDGKACRPGEHPAIQAVLDQGLGRSLWFVEGMDTDRIARTVGGFPERRRPDLWSGVGLACAYAGGAGADEIRALRDASGDAWRHLGQGACFAAEARSLAGNLTEDCELACGVLCGLDARAAAVLARRVQPRPPGDGPADVALYEGWRRAVRDGLPAGSSAR